MCLKDRVNVHERYKLVSLEIIYYEAFIFNNHLKRPSYKYVH